MCSLVQYITEAISSGQSGAKYREAPTNNFIRIWLEKLGIYNGSGNEYWGEYVDEDTGDIVIRAMFVGKGNRNYSMDSWYKNGDTKCPTYKILLYKEKKRNGKIEFDLVKSADTEIEMWELIREIETSIRK